MFVLARHVGESVLLAGGLIEVKVVSIIGGIARLGFECPGEIDIVRKELKPEEVKNGDRVQP